MDSSALSHELSSRQCPQRLPFPLVGREQNPKISCRLHLSLGVNKVAGHAQDAYLVIASVSCMAAWLPGKGITAVWFPHLLLESSNPGRCGVVFHYRPHLKLMLFNWFPIKIVEIYIRQILDRSEFESQVCEVPILMTV